MSTITSFAEYPPPVQEYLMWRYLASGQFPGPGTAERCLAVYTDRGRDAMIMEMDAPDLYALLPEGLAVLGVALLLFVTWSVWGLD